MSEASTVSTDINEITLKSAAYINELALFYLKKCTDRKYHMFRININTLEQHFDKKQSTQQRFDKKQSRLTQHFDKKQS